MALINAAPIMGVQSYNKASVKLNAASLMCQPLTHNNSQPLSGNVKVYGNADHLGNNLNRVV